MQERDGYVPGVPCWIDTSQPDPEAAVAFYRGLFGWDFEDVMPPGSPGKYFIARLSGGDVAAVGSQPEGAPPMAVWNTYIWVDSADDAAAKAVEHGGQVMMEAFDVMDAGRMAVIADPEGAVFCVWQPKDHKGAQVVNENGSLVANQPVPWGRVRGISSGRTYMKASPMSPPHSHLCVPATITSAPRLPGVIGTIPVA